VQLAFELGYTTPAFRSLFGTNNGIAGHVLLEGGTAEQQAALLPRLASGELTAAFALTESEAGSDPAGLTTEARREDGGWVIDGAKRYITNAPIADLFTVLARTGQPGEGSRSTTCFLVKRGTPGIATGTPHRKMGQAGSPVSEVYLQDCRVPEHAILGGTPGRGFASVMKALNKQRINLAALCIGPAIRMLDEALRHATTRRQFGRPVADFQLVQAMLADCKVEIEAARSLVLDTARKRDAGKDVTMEASMCKYFASEIAGRVADRVVQIFGGAGYCEDIGGAVPRIYRDVRLFRLYEGTSQIHQLNIAKHLLASAGPAR
jgi:acyl-CoA dehydrogenase